MKSVDQDTFVFRYSPRKPASVWSKTNVARVERLLSEGRMAPAGLAMVEEAKRRGTWAEASTDREGLDEVTKRVRSAKKPGGP